MPKGAKLHSTWVFWHDRWSTTPEGESMHTITDLGDASTAREFWALLNHNPVDALPEDCSIHVFRKNVKPEWEDPQNANGGHFRFMNVKPDVVHNECKIWDAILLHAVSEDFQLSSSICGVGFSHKKQQRKVVSLWLNTTDVGVIRSIQTELSPHITENYLVRFVAHHSLRRHEFTEQQYCQHRRIQSAPTTTQVVPHHQKFVSVDFDIPESQDAGAASAGIAVPSAQAPVSPASAALNTTASAAANIKRKVRRPPSPLRHGIKTHDSSSNEEELMAHHRSRSDTHATDVIPQMTALMRSRNGTPPPGDEVASSQGSGVYPSMKAPTPLKVWADQWSPSMLYAALGVKPPMPIAPQQHERTSAQPGEKPPLPAKRDKASNAGGGATAASSAAATEEKSALSASAERARQTKSDATAFVHNGWLFPAGLNRKERRRIVFSGEVDPATYPGAVFVGENIPAGVTSTTTGGTE